MENYKYPYTLTERRDLISGKLIVLRSAAGLTQTEVAEKIGIKVGTYNTYENKRSEPPAEVIVRLAYLYGVSTDEILQKEVQSKDPEKMKSVLKENEEAIKTLEKILKEGDPEKTKIISEEYTKIQTIMNNILTNINENIEETE